MPKIENRIVIIWQFNVVFGTTYAIYYPERTIS